MINPRNILSTPALRMIEPLYKVFHDTSLYGDGTRSNPLKILSPLPTQTGNSGRFLITNGTTVSWSTAITNPSDGIITLSNAAGTDFSRIQFGGTTSAFPSLKRSTTELQARLADDSNFAAVQTLYQRFGSGSPEGVVTAPIGAIYHRTNGGAATSLYVKESGAGNTG